MLLRTCRLVSDQKKRLSLALGGMLIPIKRNEKAGVLQKLVTSRHPASNRTNRLSVARLRPEVAKRTWRKMDTTGGGNSPLSAPGGTWISPLPRLTPIHNPFHVTNNVRILKFERSLLGDGYCYPGPCGALP